MKMRKSLIILIRWMIAMEFKLLKIYHAKFFNIFINIISLDIQKTRTYNIAHKTIIAINFIKHQKTLSFNTLLSIFLFFPNNLNLIKMNVKMQQAEIDALINDSMFKDSEISHSHTLSKKQIKKNNEEVQNRQYEQSYGGQQFQSYEESRRTFQKNGSKNDFQEGKKQIKNNTKLEEIKQQNPIQAKNSLYQSKKSLQKQKAKTGLQFYPPKHTNNVGLSAQKKQSLPYNYARLQQRQKQLLLTTLTQQNKQLKESLRIKDNDYKKLQAKYNSILRQKSQNAPSVKQITLQKQLAALSSKYEKLQNLFKLQKQKSNFKFSKTKESFVPEHLAKDREQQLLEIIDKLKERLTSTHNELKTLQNKMNEGDNYVDELKRKLKRIEQLQYKMQKMTQQAENDRDFIQVLKDKNKQIEKQLYEKEKEKKMLEMQMHRLKLGQATQTDTAKQLAEVRRQKQKLQSHLRDLTSNLLTKVSPYSRQINHIQDSGQLLKP